MAGAIQGKLIGVKINGTQIRCQTDATTTINREVTDNERCKPQEGESSQSQNWTTHAAGAKSWSISVTGKTFADEELGVMDNSEIVAAMIEGSGEVEVTFQTIQTSDYDHPSVFVYEGTGTLTSFTHNAPEEGDSTYDLEITGNGELTYSKMPTTS